MTFETINTGAAPNDGTGDPLRDAFDKVNGNFAQAALVETGTWTPALAGSTTAGNHSYTTQQGRYVKHGRLVHVSASINVNVWDTNAAGTLRVTGLPFNPVGQSGAYTAVPGFVTGVATVPANFTAWYFRSDGTNSWLNLTFHNSATGLSNFASVSVAQDGFEIRFALTYETDA